ncbi:esterase [Pseudomonas oryzihabitans]|nr:arylesterase [Pseudomonas psychrotolerans]KTT10168.1 esterase [Pseudomonas psychrotolerans]KTT28537.1 esterase [Pseudomonas psychrotolerans]KTT32503.1 esterase [Pseudomonas psychrotolerans]KTT77930.1 esterase [Pseudomonas psychrotolerans]
MRQGIAWLLAVACLLLTPLAMARTLLVVGDSISAGYGLADGQGWVRLLENRLQEQQSPYQVVNASISGDTTAGGLARLPQLLAAHRPEVVAIELGGNDGLRGQPLAQFERNLTALVQQAKAKGARVLLLGMRLPPNYGPRYTEGFAQVYQDVAKAQQVALVPFLLEGVGGDPAFMQPDGIHPRANAQQRLLDNAWPELQRVLRD